RPREPARPRVGHRRDARLHPPAEGREPGHRDHPLYVLPRPPRGDAHRGRPGDALQVPGHARRLAAGRVAGLLAAARSPYAVAQPAAAAQGEGIRACPERVLSDDHRPAAARGAPRAPPRARELALSPPALRGAARAPRLPPAPGPPPSRASAPPPRAIAF